MAGKKTGDEELTDAGTPAVERVVVDEPTGAAWVEGHPAAPVVHPFLPGDVDEPGTGTTPRA